MKILKYISIYGGLLFFIIGIIISIGFTREKIILDHIRIDGSKSEYEIIEINCETETIKCQNADRIILKEINEYCESFFVGQKILLINTGKYPDRYIFEDAYIAPFQILMGLLVSLIGLVPLLIFKFTEKEKSAPNNGS